MKPSTREEWLHKSIEKFCRTHFKDLGYTIPKDIRVSTGFPGGRGSKKAIGQHWHPDAADDKIGNIFISPVVDDTEEVLGILVHELVHASVGNEAKHGPKFRKCALAVGLEGSMKATTVGAGLSKKFEDLVKTVGKYPHAKINLAMNPIKKQTTRMKKLTCLGCGFICRASMSKLIEVGPPLCACNSEPMEMDI